MQIKATTNDSINLTHLRLEEAVPELRSRFIAIFVPGSFISAILMDGLSLSHGRRPAFARTRPRAPALTRDLGLR